MGLVPYFSENNNDMLYQYAILGRPHDPLNEVQMENNWLSILRFVSVIYRKNVNYKRGIGQTCLAPP